MKNEGKMCHVSRNGRLLTWESSDVVYASSSRRLVFSSDIDVDKHWKLSLWALRKVDDEDFVLSWEKQKGMLGLGTVTLWSMSSRPAVDHS